VLEYIEEGIMQDNQPDGEPPTSHQQRGTEKTHGSNQSLKPQQRRTEGD
jgi:hypothetical protein